VIWNGLKVGWDMQSGRVIEIALRGLVYVPLEKSINIGGFFHGDQVSLLAPYLFSSRKWEPVFAESQKKLHELNNVIVLLRDALDDEGRYQLSAQEVVRHAEEDNGECHLYSEAYPGEDEDVARSIFEHEVEVGLELLAYNKIGCLYAPASALTLLYATFIKILRSIGEFYDPFRFKKWLTENGRSPELQKLISALEYISGERKIPELRTRRFEELINSKAKRVRNAFVHGDWDEIERIMLKTPAHSCFDVVRESLEALEETFTKEHFPNFSGSRSGPGFSV
jgi:hypothetical protein